MTQHEHNFKSKSLQKKQVRTINGTKTRYTKPNPTQPRCPETGEQLKGIKRQRSNERTNTSKSSKRPNRPYGGKLSSKAARQRHKQKARNTTF